MTAIEAACLRLNTKVLGWTEEAVRKHVQEVEADIRSKKMHAYIPM